MRSRVAATLRIAWGMDVTRTTSRRLASLLAGLAVLAGACGTTLPSTAPGASGQPVAAATAAAPTGPLRVAFSALGNQALDPLISDVGNKVYLTLMFDYLVDIDRQSGLDPKRSIAESFELSADKRVHTYKIRKGVKFQDGSDLTSADVKFSLERITRANSKSAYAGNLRDQLAKIEAPDPNTVIVTTKNPSIFLDYDLSPLIGNEGAILPKAYIEKNGDAYFQTHPMGSGPYKFVDFKSGDYLKLTAFDGYWKFKTTYKDIEFKIIPEESTRAALLQRKEADIINVGARKANELEKAGFRKLTKNGDPVTILLDAQWLPPFNDKRVREAMNIAVDRKAINDSLFDGAATVTGNYPVNSLDLGYKSQPLYPYDVERAKALLKEAGVPNPKITAYSYERAGLSDGPRLMQALAGMWQAIGAQVEIKATEYSSVRTLQQNDQLPGGSVHIINAGGQLVGTARLSSIFGTKALLSVTRDPKMDEFIASVGASSDLATYKTRMGQVADYIRENHLTLPLVESGDIYLTPTSIRPWDFTKTAFSADILNLVEKR